MLTKYSSNKNHFERVSNLIRTLRRFFNERVYIDVDTTLDIIEFLTRSNRR